MALLSLTMEGIGPFEKTELDFSDGHGKPHMGPHIIAGVNGSGKSTVLRAIAATVAVDRDEDFVSGFPLEWWGHRMVDWNTSEAATTWMTNGPDPCVVVRSTTPWFGLRQPSDWPNAAPMAAASAGGRLFLANRLKVNASLELDLWSSIPTRHHAPLVVAYAPSLVLRDMSPYEMGKANATESANALAFGGTVDAATVQLWIQNLRSSVSITKEQGADPSSYIAGLAQIESALESIMGSPVALEVVPGWEMRLRARAGNQLLNFSQLPDGARNLLGWFMDFVRRRETAAWRPGLAERKPCVLLIDEIDAHLHPRWQRTILPALAKAFEGQEVQIIVTTHSPFVISSCPGARVHVLEVDEQGHATARAPIDAPVGQSVNATMIDIFGVESRFDVQTERELNEWNDLRRKQAGSPLSPEESGRLQHLTDHLAGKSEELRLLVGTGSKIPEEMLMSWFRG